MNIAVIPNLNKTGVEKITSEIIQRLTRLGACVLFEEQYKYLFSSFKCRFFNRMDELFDECETVLSVGGDGTLIHTAKKTAKYNKPVLGINVGRLGFVASIDVDELDRLDDLVAGNYTTQKRMMLKVTIINASEKKQFYALNDIVISRGEFSKIIDVDITANGVNVCRYRADGVIIATPTGSTAYSLSAGGPIVDPGMDCILFTPICSHSIFSKSQIFSSNTQLTINTKFTADSSAILTVDGDNVIEISKKTAVMVEKAEISANLINFSGQSFYKVLSEKFLGKKL